MTLLLRTIGPLCLPLAAVCLAIATGCKHLAPGISPLASDPPSYADYGYADEPDAATRPWTGSWSSDLTHDGESHDGESPMSGVIPVDADDQRYVARQFPQDYTSPLPPPQGTQPPSVYQSPQGSVYQPPPTYQPPSGTVLPPSGTPVQPPSPLSGATSTPLHQPGQQPFMPQQPAPGQFGGVDQQPAPFFPGGPIADSLYGPPGMADPYLGEPTAPPIFTPNTRMADLELTGVPARTGRIMFGGAVNSDAGVTGQITVDERNFDITRWPTSFQDFANGTAFRGAGQTFRVEAVPGNIFKRYTVSFADPNLFGYLPISLGVSGFLYDRRFRDFDEERLGGRVSFGYRVTPDLSLTSGITGQNVKIHRPRIQGVQALEDVLRDNELYTAEFRITHDTRDSPFQPTEGRFLELGYERGFGMFDYNRYDIENRNYLLLAQRADGSGKQTVMYSTRVGFSGEDTPMFENYFAGGYATMRGFDFRGASPVEGGVQVGGRFQWLNTLEYMFPITADDAFRGVAFVDFGTVERDIRIQRENFRVAPGLGLRVAIPMLGPAPLAFDFAYPVTMADGDERRIFSFYMSAFR